ncbi:hypothetical protein DH2020_036098 [Rehmannia glutinosa]|uniref:Dymeclin n=1 Tax=Rehmannia glutinosa TaxID=99300 RepID=A0ABR0V7Y4_REHGL
MGGTPSTPRLGGGARPQETAEYLIGEFVGEKSFPLASDYWHKLLELPLDLRWQSHRVRQACQLFAAMNNCKTRHLAKILIHLAWCLQECISASDVASPAFSKALNASFISSVFLKYLIENSKSDNFEELYLLLDESDPLPNNFSEDLNDLHIIFSSSGPFRAVDLLDFVPRLFHLQAGQHVENLIMFSALNFIGKVDISPETNLLHQELLNFILITMSTQLLSGPTPGLNDIHPFIDAAMAQESSLVNLVMRKLLLNYITRPQFPVNSSSSITLYEGNQPGVLRRVSSAAANLMFLPFNYLVSSTGEASRSPLAEGSLNVLLILSYYHKCISVDYVKYKSDNNSSEALLKEETYFSENPFRKALENAQDIEFDRDDTEANAHGGPLIRLPFASLFDTLGIFSEYVLVRTDLDTLLMPMLETLYNAPSRTSNHIYMVLVIFLILSQDSSFNASVHKLDVYLHTNCLATLANMAPHVHRLSSYASQQLVSLFDMLSRKYNKLAEIKNEKMNVANGDPRGDSLPEDPVVYSIIHRQEVFLPFKNHPRFSELLENIYTVLDFFNSRIDAQKVDGEWSVEKVLQVVINHCRSWRGEGMKLRFTYEQESHPEEFFIPYVWQLVLSHSGFTFSSSSINLFPVPVEDINGQEVEKIQNGELKEHALQVETPV